MKPIDKILKYTPYNEQEEKDKELFISCLSNENNIFTRDNKLVHLTASSWIINEERNKILLCYHNIYNSWTWLGGHADGDEDLLNVAIKEAKEESGLINIKPLDDGNIFSLESLCVEGHIKKGVYVSSHIHLNVTYLLEANDKEILKIKEDENKNLGWFDFDDIYTLSNEAWFIKNIYPKLNDKLRDFINRENKNI